MISGKAYSVDLREKVISAVTEGTLKLCEIAQIFKINVKTIYKWRIQFKETGSVIPKKRNKDTYKCKIKDVDEFKDFVKNHKNSTLKEMAIKLGNVSPKTVGNTLKRINFTFKKKHFIIKNEMKKKEKNFKKKSKL